MENSIPILPEPVVTEAAPADPSVVRVAPHLDTPDAFRGIVGLVADYLNKPTVSLSFRCGSSMPDGQVIWLEERFLAGPEVHVIACVLPDTYARSGNRLKVKRTWSEELASKLWNEAADALVGTDA